MANWVINRLWNSVYCKLSDIKTLTYGLWQTEWITELEILFMANWVTYSHGNTFCLCKFIDLQTWNSFFMANWVIYRFGNTINGKLSDLKTGKLCLRLSDLHTWNSYSWQTELFTDKEKKVMAKLVIYRLGYTAYCKLGDLHHRKFCYGKISGL